MVAVDEGLGVNVTHASGQQPSRVTQAHVVTTGSGAPAAGGRVTVNV